MFKINLVIGIVLGLFLTVLFLFTGTQTESGYADSLSTILRKNNINWAPLEFPTHGKVFYIYRKSILGGNALTVVGFIDPQTIDHFRDNKLYFYLNTFSVELPIQLQDGIPREMLDELNITQKAPSRYILKVKGADGILENDMEGIVEVSTAEKSYLMKMCIVPKSGAFTLNFWERTRW